MRRILTLAAVMTGCSGTTWRVVSESPGRARIVVECRNSIGDCYDGATDACPSGYDVVESSDGQAYQPNLFAAFGEKDKTTCERTSASEIECEHTPGTPAGQSVYAGTLVIDCHR